MGFIRSHWMPPLGERLCNITLAVAMVDNFGCKHKNTTKTQLLASNYGTNQPPMRISYPEIDPLLSSLMQLRNNVRCHGSTRRAQLYFQLSNVVSRQKLEKLLTQQEACYKGGRIYAPIGVKLLTTQSLRRNKKLLYLGNFLHTFACSQHYQNCHSVQMLRLLQSPYTMRTLKEP